MTLREFYAEAKKMLAAAGCTNVDIYDGNDALSVSCDYKGERLSHHIRFGCGRPEDDIYRQMLKDIDASFPVLAQ